jgi:nicotinamidase-related amidase
MMTSRKVLGKDIKLDLEETASPKTSALIVVDMQNDFCTKGGHYEKAGKNLNQIQSIIPQLSKLIHTAREYGIPVIYVQNTQIPGGSYLSPPAIAHLLARWKDESNILYTLEGTWGHQIIEDIKPERTDFIVKKHRPSAFAGTDLDLILRSSGVDTIIVTGVVTEGCVESTARHGWLKDYYVVIAEDCVASSTAELYRAQMKLMKKIYHFVVPAKKLITTWQKKYNK